MDSNRKKIHILFIHHATGLGGAPLNMINIIRCLDPKIFSYHVLLIKESEVADQLKQYKIPYSVAESLFYKRFYNYFIHSEANYVKWFQVIRFIKLTILWLLSRHIFAKIELEKIKYDIVHLNSSVLTDWLKPSKMYGKVVINIQEPYRKGRWDFLHKYFRIQYDKFSDRIVCISQDNADRINLPQKTDIIYNFIYPLYENMNNVYPTKKSVLYLGGDQKIKGFFTIVDALDYLNKDIIVIFGGYYSQQNTLNLSLKKVLKRLLRINKKLDKYITKLYNSSNAEILGYIEDTNPYFHKISCLISPFSISHFSRPIIEAYLNHKPVIATNIDGIQEMVIDGVTGIIVNIDDPIELAKAINYLTSNPLVAQNMGLKGYEFALTRFTPKNISKYEEIYMKLVN